ncbi:myb/SANT-like DNA-binding domain-containing protein 7 [Corticium candelabrum]|uniref:myb/SANT-like DNA-binding domain-containing protein 7 n=1 Tax=Corticium candelabrum TaxID=121492 RepID=UPI002E255353|nr:myb/SANT-like DNA-binding domain-containing protein 7 [Corticium candelabrum]
MAWTEQETLLLIDLWGEESVQVQIEGCARNKAVYAKLAARMQEEGYNRSGTQCREKIKKLKTDYRKVKDNNNESGRARRSSRIFEAMDAILGHKPATCPPIVLESTNNPAHTDVTAVDSDASGSQGIELDDYGDESCVGELALSNCSSTGTTSRSTPTSSVCPVRLLLLPIHPQLQSKRETERREHGRGKARLEIE